MEANYKKNIFTDLVVFFPFLLILPYNFALYLPGFPLLTTHRTYILVLFFMWLYHNGIGGGIQKIFRGFFPKLLFLTYFIIPLISIITNDSSSSKMLYRETFLLLPFIFSLGYYILNNEIIIKIFLRNLIIAGFLLNIIVLIQYILNYDFSYDLLKTFSTIPEAEYKNLNINKYFELREGFSRIQASFPHPIALGVFTATFSLFLIPNLFKYLFKYWKVLIVIFFAGNLFTIYATVSRTPLILIFILLILYLILFKKINIYLMILIGLPAIFLLNVLTDIGFGLEQTSGRIDLINDFIINFDKIKVTGIGLGAFSAYGDSPFLIGFRLLDPMAFNVTMIIEVGLIYIPFILMMIAGVIIKYKRQTNDEFIDLFISFVLIIFISNLITSITSISIFNSGNISSIIFWILLGSYFRIVETRRKPIINDPYNINS